MIFEFSLIFPLWLSLARAEVFFLIVDGFSGKYLNTHKHVHGLKKLVDNGVSSENLVPSFPAQTMPNFFSMVTGHHPQDHGIIADYFTTTDRGMERRFYGGTKLGDFDSHFLKASPVWSNLLRKQYGPKKPVYLAQWPGCGSTRAADDDLRDHAKKTVDCNPAGYVRSDVNASIISRDSYFSLGWHTFFGAFHNNLTIQTQTRGFVDVLTLKGDDNPVIQLERVLFAIKTFIDAYNKDQRSRAERDGRQPKLYNLVVAGTHGWKDVPFHNQTEWRDDIALRMLDYTTGGGAFLLVEPRPGQEQQLHDQLNKINPVKNAKVYWTDPDTKFAGKRLDARYKFNSKKNPNIPQLILMAEPGTAIFTMTGKHFPPLEVPGAPRHQHRKSFGGFDNFNEDMAAGFIAYGPSFKKGVELKELHAVDIYPLLCSLANVTCPQRSGSMDRVFHATTAGTDGLTRTAVFTLLLTIVLNLLLQ